MRGDRANKKLRWPGTPGRASKNPAWAKVYKALAKIYQWGPEQVESLTLYQAYIYLGAEGPDDGVVNK